MVNESWPTCHISWDKIDQEAEVDSTHNELKVVSECTADTLGPQPRKAGDGGAAGQSTACNWDAKN